MDESLKKWMGAAICCFILGGGQGIVAQKVVFPQAKQAGLATLTSSETEYTLKNDLLTAKFVKDGSALVFGGCEEMNLKAGSPLFKVVLGDGTSFTSSEMQLQSIEEETLTGNAEAVKGSDRFDGKALKAVFKKDKLNVTWHAVLRNGSHYLRTTLEITADADQAMQSLTPMIYTVDSRSAQSAPVVVGNTRGALLASDKIFAGLETPMGVNSVESASTSIANFTPKSWTPESFNWTPGDETPQGVLDVKVKNEPLTASEVVGARGYVTFREAGANKITFTYASGNHRLDIAGVDVVDTEGNVVASDYHYGFTGSQKNKNSYTLNLENAGTYLLRYFCETRTETLTSSGNITFNKKISVPVVIYDLVSGETSKVSSPVVKGAATVLATTTGATTLENDNEVSEGWNSNSWTVVEDASIPYKVKELDLAYPNVLAKTMTVHFDEAGGTLKSTFIYSSGNNRLNMVGVDLLDASNSVVVGDYHSGFSGYQKENNEYSFKVPAAGDYTLRFMIENSTEPATSSGNIKLLYAVVDTIHLAAPTEIPMQGYWRRNTTLSKGKTWEVSSVVGLVAPGQQRRSFLSYSERERAVPWRALPVYISWYELNIDRNNAKGNGGVYDASDPNNTKGDYTGNMTSEQCLDVVTHWKEKFYDVYNKTPYAFVWDDGWDAYGTWTFNSNFPNGFTGEDNLAKSMGAGIGAWLGPVGGYGGSGTYRRNYWSSRGGMQLSNQTYRDYFVKCCTDMIDKYDFRFFKFDGISAQGTAYGPDSGDTGIENAEAIIDIEKDVRKKREDIFYNTTVGTWASPFWFHYTDAVWRQDADCSKIGNTGTDREQWITYRDYMVYKIFTQGSPLCPINTLMTHGLILTNFGKAYTPRDMSYNGVVREMRCAFGCGSGMVELYTDYSLMDGIKNAKGQSGMLWKELSDCMDWQQRNADVLPDIHWVGGNPWDGSKVNVYGWASWNGKKTTLTLRNPDVKQRTLTTTLREVFDIPAYIKTTITLKSSFDDQVIGTTSGLQGVEVGKPVNIDDEITFTLPASSVYVFEGVDNGNFDFVTAITKPQVTTSTTTKGVAYDISGRRIAEPQKGMVSIVDGKKVIK